MSDTPSTARPSPITATPTCDRCGTPLPAVAGIAILCGPGGGGVALRTPLGPCQDPDCRRERDEEAIARAVASGLITEGDPDRECRSCGDECEYLSTDYLCDGCVAEGVR